MDHRPIIWALEPFDTPRPTVKTTCDFLNDLVLHTGGEVIPSYGFDSAMTSVGPQPVARSISDLLEEFELSHADPQIMANAGYSADSQAEDILELARRVGAKMIVVNSGGKNLAQRFFLGSFTEYLVQHSHIPILVLSERVAQWRGLKRVLFPSDVSAESLESFRACVDTFSLWGKQISILSEVVQPQSTIATAMGGSWVNIEPFPIEEMHRIKRSMEPLVNYARNHGMDVDTTIENMVTSTAQAIETYMNAEPADIIAMASESDTLSRSLFGSIGREVIARATVPVWLTPVNYSRG